MAGLLSRLSGPSDGDRLTLGDHTVRLRINPRSSRISLRIDRESREAVASAPSRRALSKAVEFARSRQDWIAERLAALPPKVALAPGLSLTLFGAPLVLTASAGRARLDLETGRLLAPDDAAFGVRVTRLLKGHARQELIRRTGAYAARLGRPAPKVAITDAKRRWGSCSPARPGREASIRYSWRLALAPDFVAEYVVAHECAHLAEANHGPAFWRLVGELYGDYRKPKAWLRSEGDALHALTD